MPLCMRRSERKQALYSHTQIKSLRSCLRTQEAKYLDVVKGYPLLSIKSVVHDQSGENCYLSRQLCIADKFKLMV